MPAPRIQIPPWRTFLSCHFYLCSFDLVCSELMQLQPGITQCHKLWVKLKSTLDYFHPTTKSCFSPSSFRDLFSSISFTKPTLILLHQQQRRVHDSMRLKMFNAKLFTNTLTRDLILSRPSTKFFLKNYTNFILVGWSPF